MHRRVLVCLTVVLWSVTLIAQQNATANVPRVVRFAGTITNADGTPRTGVVGVMFSLYSEQQGGTALWTELQNVTVDANGQYTVLLGSQHSDGVPADLFTSNEARWLGIQVEAEPEQPRVLLVSVPYALKAGDAETLGGKPLSAFLLNPNVDATTTTSGTTTTAGGTKTSSSSTLQTNSINTSTSGGAAGYVARWVDASTLGNSSLYDSGGFVGINNASPGYPLTVSGSGAFLISAVGPAGANVLSSIVQGTTKRASLYVNASNVAVLEGWQDGVGPLNFAMGPAGGNVGIGTSTPGYPLTVQGSGAFLISAVGPAGANVISSFVQGTNKRASLFINQAGAAVLEGFEDGVGPLNFAMGPAGGNVGIGTSTPTQKLTVAGTIQSTSGGYMFPDGSVLSSGNNPTASTTTQVFHVTQTGAGANTLTVATLPTAVRGDSTATSNYTSGVLGTSSSSFGFGVVGENLATSSSTNDYAIGVFGVSTQSTIGTGVWGEAEAQTGTTVGVYGKSFSSGATNTTGGTGVFGYASATSGDAVGVYGRADSTGGTGIWGDAPASTGTTFGVYGSVASSGGVAGVFDNTASGNLLIGRAGGTRSNVFRVDGTGKGFFNGGTQTGGADFAESVDVIGGVSEYEPGDVMAIDPTGKRRLTKSSEAYSPRVAGIYSTKPGVLATPHSMDDARLADEIPLAIVGIVPCKVSAENGPIKAGDLLVSASMPGFAMKATDRSKMTGAVLGKALENLASGTGVIEVLVSLQ